MHLSFLITAVIQFSFWNFKSNFSELEQYINYLDFETAYNSVMREVLYNILTEFCIPMKLVSLIKVCLNKITICLMHFLFRMV